MACTRPITGYYSADINPATGKRRIVFGNSGYHDRPVQFPCGQCLGCRMERSRQWAIRCSLEAQLWPENIFLTLTYDDAHLPPNFSLRKRDFQLFMKRLRKEYGAGIRFFAAGEYGTKSLRPHYHAILFNFRPSDGEPITGGCQPLFISPSLMRLWPYGYHSYGNVTFESSAYVARYCLKKLTGPDQKNYGLREPEFALMSRRPGIGHDWFLKYNQDVYPVDQVVVRDNIKVRPPKYFDALYERYKGPDALLSVKTQRRIKAFEAFKKDMEKKEEAYSLDFIRKAFYRCYGDVELWNENRYKELYQSTRLSQKEEKL